MRDGKTFAIVVGIMLVLGLTVAIVMVGWYRNGAGSGYRLCAAVECHSTGYCRCTP